MDKMALRTAALAVIVLAGSAGAAPSPQTGNVNVTATVNTSCTLTGPADAAFGTVDPLPTATLASSGGKITVNCNKGSSPALTLNNGSNFSGSRRMKNAAGDFLAYSIVQPLAGFVSCPAAGSGTAWSGATAVTVNVFTATGGSQDVWICAQLSTPQLGASAGSYTDTVTVTATF
jgi:outer membrane usher protein